MLRFVLIVLMISSVALLFAGCRIGDPHLAKKQNAGLDNERPMFILSPGHTEADFTNAPSRNVQVTQGSTNPIVAPYDKKLYDAINHHWRELLAEVEKEPSPPTAKKAVVVVDFRLYADGHISDVRIARSTADEEVNLMCQKAISKSAPFETWSQEIQHVINNDNREIRFSFYLNQ